MSSLLALVLLHGTLIDGTGGAAIEDAYVAIDDGRVLAVGRAADYRPSPDDDVVDAAGKWIVPGLIDTHTHLFDDGSLYTSPDDFDLTFIVPHEVVREQVLERMPETLDRYLCSGVTTVASMGGARWELELREKTRAPHVLTAGPFLGNFPVGAMTLWTEDDPVLVQLTSPEAARETARELDARGVDFLKVGFAAGAGLDLPAFRPVLAALVEEAHARGLGVAMHAEELEVARAAVSAGVDVLAHTVSDRIVDEDFLAAAKAAGVVSVSGLAHFDRYRDVIEGTVELSPIEERCGDPDAIASWKDLELIEDANRPPVPAAIRWGSSPEARAILLSNVRRLRDAGIRLAAGSNGGNVGTLQGPSYHRELVGLAEAGLTPPEVLVAATRDAALALGVLDDRGTLERGKLADVVLLGRDPLRDVENFSAIELVLVGGVEVYRASGWQRGQR